MKIVLEKEMVKLEVATRDTEKMLSGLQISSMEAKKEADQVDKIKKKCEADATRIAGEKALCEEDLAKAQPFVDEANDGKECCGRGVGTWGKSTDVFECFCALVSSSSPLLVSLLLPPPPSSQPSNPSNRATYKKSKC